MIARRLLELAVSSCRVLVENDYAGISEDQVLHQIFIDEQFPVEDVAAKAKEEKKKLAGAKAAIGYDYNEVGIRLPFLCV